MRQVAVRHVTCRNNAHTGAHYQVKVSLLTPVKAVVEILAVKRFTKVDDRVLELTSATWSVTNAPCLVLFSFGCCSNAEVSHVVSIASHTDLQVRVAMNLSDIFGRDACLAVQTINVLAHNLF